jgi:ectoine hydroxylase
MRERIDSIVATQTANQNTQITKTEIPKNGDQARGVDVYRTRLAHRSQIEPRPHNTVWGSMGNPGPLSAPELRHYADRGYHTENKVLSAADIDACLREVSDITDRLGEDDRVIRESSSGDVRSLFAVHKLSDLIAEICDRDAIRGVAEQILDDEVTIHQSRINLKPGFAGGPFYWHSDFETWHAEDGMPAPRALSVSLALTPNLSTNGPLMIIPGSHRRFVSCVGATPDGYHRESLTSYRPPFGTPEEEDVATLADELGIDTITGPAGSALYFDSNCLHASAGNITPYPRSNLFVVFNAKANALQEPFGGTAPRPDHLAHR